MSTPKPDGGPAFPRPASEFTKNGSLADGNDAVPSQGGMTLRDWFAGQFLAGLDLVMIEHRDDPDFEKPTQYTIEEKARLAYQAADAMLAERAK